MQQRREIQFWLCQFAGGEVEVHINLPIDAAKEDRWRRTARIMATQLQKDHTFKTAIVTNMRDKSTEYQIPDGSHETDLALETIKS